MKAKAKAASTDPAERMRSALRAMKSPETTAFGAAWVGLEPTFSSKKAVRKWARMAAEEGGEDAYFKHPYMLRMQRKVARGIRKHYLARQKKKDPACIFARVELERDVDQWKVERQNLVYSRSKGSDDTFEVRFGLDPETFEFSIKPVPVAWLYEAGFVRFLQRFVWDIPLRCGLAPSIAHGGGQFSFSAKTFMRGSLLADDIATRLDHPELCTWIMDYPNPDDRAFRATAARLRAFERVLEAYWNGAFHPRALGVLTVENAFLDRGFAAACEAAPNAMDDRRGPKGSARDVFQTNFAFGRAVRLTAQNVHPGYWQSAHPDEDGYRPDQIMRYSEGNLNRLQIAGELHVKSGKVLDKKDIPELNTPLELDMLYDEASWENRGQMARTSAEDMVEAVLLDVHHAMYLVAHPHVRVRASLAQDQLMAHGVETLERRAPKELRRLRKEAREANLEASHGRMKTDWLEPEVLFWSAWHHLRLGEQAAIAREAIEGFLERVHQAAALDPRNNAGDPMEAHRHRIHPELWRVLERERHVLARARRVRAEWTAWSAARKKYLRRRPVWSVADSRPPWK
jgi:hypothetical protein